MMSSSTGVLFRAPSAGDKLACVRVAGTHTHDIMGRFRPGDQGLNKSTDHVELNTLNINDETRSVHLLFTLGISFLHGKIKLNLLRTGKGYKRIILNCGKDGIELSLP